MHVVMVCGHKYGFRSICVPLLRQLREAGSIRVYLQDYPEGYEIGSLLQALQREGAIQEAVLIPESQHVVAHHRAVQRACRALRAAPIDLLLVEGDSVPMDQYFIRLARAKGARVVALQVTVPARLMAVDEAKMARSKGNSGRGPFPTESARSRFRRRIVKLVRGPGRLRLIFHGLRVPALYARYAWRVITNYWLLPLCFTGRTLSLHRMEWRDMLYFLSDRVDAAIVYSERLKEALGRMAPRLDVRLAQHPLSTNCRCRGDERKSKLLVTLKGPWRNYLGASGSSELVEEQWCGTVRRAVALKGFSEVHIRPHPREDGEAPQRLVERLASHGITAHMMDTSAKPVPEVICDYAGLLGAPSGALAEAAAACRHAFVVGVDGIQLGTVVPSANAYSSEVVSVSGNEALRAEHFARPPGMGEPRQSVREVLQAMLMEGHMTSEGSDARGS